MCAGGIKSKARTAQANKARVGLGSLRSPLRVSTLTYHQSGVCVKSEIEAKFKTYPVQARSQLEYIRRLIFAIAQENSLGTVEETVKWGEPSYRVKGGSTVRIDWKPKDPDVVKVFFHCQSKLIETFKEIYPEVFQYEGKRAIVIPLGDGLEGKPLHHCLQMALNYHSLKGLPLLGA